MIQIRDYAIFIIIVTLILFMKSHMIAQPNDGDIVVSKVNDLIHKLYVSDYVYMYTFSGADGTLLIDTGYKVDSTKLMSVLGKLNADNVKFIINTHSNDDHIGGNHLFKNAVIIAHQNSRNYLRLKDNFPIDGLPNITLESELTIHLNSEEIKVYATPGSHTDGDLVIHFIKSKLVFLGDIVVPDTFPVIWLDYFENVSTKKLVENIRTIINLFPDDVKFISSHGRDYKKSDLEDYLLMINETIALVKYKIEQGKSMQEIIDENTLKDYRSFDSKQFKFINADLWIETIFKDLTSQK